MHTTTQYAASCIGAAIESFLIITVEVQKEHSVESPQALCNYISAVKSVKVEEDSTCVRFSSFLETSGVASHIQRTASQICCEAENSA